MLPRRVTRVLTLLAFPLILALAAAPADHATAGPDPAPAAGRGESLSLVTGDQVWLEPAGDGRLAATIEPAPRAGGTPVFETLEVDEDFYVIPSDAVPLIPDRLDRELFNVTKLAEYGYTGGTPVIVTGEPRAARGAAGGVEGMSVTAHLPSVGGYAATVTPDGAWWQSVVTDATGETARAAGTAKLWLDELAEVSLDESVPMVGAPDAWAAGYDGTGITVAVLDSGIDDTHPDLAGQVVGAQDFTPEPDATDTNGHGTHVAGILAGTGSASGGGYTGVAPGARLLNGKVCDRFGNCSTSSMIAGMEWAAPRADLVNVSIGSFDGSDGTDPVSQAVDTLTAQHDTLFVISAGNSGVFGEGTVGAPGAASAALTVGSVDKDGALAETSSRGPRLGDHAIKPDITAPGEGIVSSRAAGTALGTVVNEHYTQLSGTSMAAPHVAGAAAIVLQQAPDLGAAELKAALAATAAPHPDLTVDQQGGGLLDIPAALAAPVRATPAPVDLGSFRYPHDDTAPVEAEVTYTNRTGAPVTLDLRLEVSGGDGGTAPPEMLAVSPATVTVEAGGAATTTVTLDVTEGGFGRYGGYLIGAVAGVDQVHTPVGFFKEAETYHLTIEGIARNGSPASSTNFVDVVDVDNLEDLWTSAAYRNGEVTIRVPRGTYHVMGFIDTYGGHGESVQSRSLVGLPELAVTQDMTVVLDARDARPVRIDTPAHEDAAPFGPSRVGAYREAARGGGIARTVSASGWLPTYAVETPPVTRGDFEFYIRTRIAAPPVAAELTSPVAAPLHPRPMAGTPPHDGARELPLVWAGSGEESDYQGVDATGAAVLTMRGGPDGAAKEATARAHGAAALLVMNDTTGNYPGSVGDAARIPAMTVSGEEGSLLRALLDDGAVTVRISGTSVTPYLYDVLFAQPHRIPGALRFVADPRQLATVNSRFHSSVPGQAMGELRHSWRPYEGASVGYTTRLPAPQARTEYLTGGDTLYRREVTAAIDQDAGEMRERITSYRAGEQRGQSWFESPLVPGIRVASTGEPAIPAFRVADTLDLSIPEWVDNGESDWGFADTSVDSTVFRLYQDGELIAEAPDARGDFAVGPDPATYRLELDVARDADWWLTSTATRTAWTIVDSARPPAGQTAVLPLLLVDYDADLGLTNTAPPRQPPAIELRVGHQPGAEGLPIDRTAAAVSYDDSVTWQSGQVVPQGDGRYAVQFPPPPPGAEFASLRVEVQDAGGNRIEQEVANAWRLP